MTIRDARQSERESKCHHGREIKCEGERERERGREGGRGREREREREREV